MQMTQMTHFKDAILSSCQNTSVNDDNDCNENIGDKSKDIQRYLQKY
jgi:hypothetical protein